ncbi:unnamed protein product, partial [Brenthis ino]
MQNSEVELPLPKRSIATTIELPLFINMVAVSLTGPVVSNIILYRTCVHSLNYTQDKCRPYLSPIKSNDTINIEEEVQKYSTNVWTVKVVIEYLFPALLSLFLGVWSDTYGRKPLIVWPLLGMSLTGILIVVYSVMDNLGPWWYILTSVPFSVTGGYVILYSGAYCFVSDTSSSDSTTIRMTMVDATTSLGSVVGTMLSTYLILTIGNTYLLLITAALNVIAYAFTNIWIMESLTGALQNGVSRIFDCLLVKEMFGECFKERPNHGRAQIILLCFIRLLLVMILFGTVSLEYLYTRQKLHWSLRDYTEYSATSTIVGLAGGFFGAIVLQKCLNIGDITFATIAIITSTVDSLMKLFAVEKWQMYLGSSISMFRGLHGPLIRSFLKKTLPLEDISKVFFLVCMVESIGPLVAPVLFNSVYAMTLAIFPGAIYVLSTVMFASCLVMLGFVQYYSRNRESVNYLPIDNSTDT